MIKPKINLRVKDNYLQTSSFFVFNVELYLWSVFCNEPWTFCQELKNKEISISRLDYKMRFCNHQWAGILAAMTYQVLSYQRYRNLDVSRIIKKKPVIIVTTLLSASMTPYWPWFPPPFLWLLLILCCHSSLQNPYLLDCPWFLSRLSSPLTPYAFLWGLILSCAYDSWNLASSPDLSVWSPKENIQLSAWHLHVGL